LWKKTWFLSAQPKPILRLKIFIIFYRKFILPSFLFQEVKFWWEKNNTTFDGQSAEDTLENEVRLKVMNESAGEDEIIPEYGLDDDLQVFICAMSVIVSDRENLV
jgi:hypothetical protein